MKIGFDFRKKKKMTSQFEIPENCNKSKWKMVNYQIDVINSVLHHIVDHTHFIKSCM